jgi:hypothetical protein
VSSPPISSISRWICSLLLQRQEAVSPVTVDLVVRSIGSVPFSSGVRLPRHIPQREPIHQLPAQTQGVHLVIMPAGWERK